MADDQSKVVYTSHTHVERIRGPLRRVHLQYEDEPIYVGFHEKIAAYYGRDPADFDTHATTLDYVIAATGAWLTGTFGGALEARQIPAGEGYLVSDITGEVETENKVLVIKRIHVRYQLKIAPEQRETAERVHGFHADYCPVARSVRDCIDISTTLEMQDLAS